MTEKGDIYFKCKVWKAGTGTKVLGIAKRDAELHDIKEGEIMLLKVVERYPNTQLSEDKTLSEKQEKDAVQAVKGVKSSGKPPEATAPVKNKGGGRFNIQ